MSKDGLLHYLVTCIDENCDIKRMHTPGEHLCLVEVKPCHLILDWGDIQTIEELENGANWVIKTSLHKRLRDCLRTKKEVKDE